MLRAFGNERYYMRELPVHHTQRAIGEGRNYIDYEVRLRPTLDFMGYIVSRSALVKVMEPQSLADKIRDMHKESMELYT